MRLIEKLSLNGTYQSISQAAHTGVQGHPTEIPLLSMNLNLTAASTVRMPLIFTCQKKTTCGCCSRVFILHLSLNSHVSKACSLSLGLGQEVLESYQCLCRWGPVCVWGGPLGCRTRIFLFFFFSFWILVHKSSYLFYIYSHHSVLTHRRPKPLLSLSWKDTVKS